MIESYENVLQLTVLLICSGITLSKAAKERSPAWILLSLFYISWLMGDIYWTVCLLFYGDTPQISFVSDLSWYAAYLFLYLILRHASPPKEEEWKRVLPWFGAAFTVAMTAFFITRGEIFTNLIYGGTMGLLIFSALSRLSNPDRVHLQRFLILLILVFCLLEYALWTASCFFSSDTIANPYYWFDFLLSVSFPFFIPAVKKAVKT